MASPLRDELCGAPEPGTLEIVRESMAILSYIIEDAGPETRIRSALWALALRGVPLIKKRIRWQPSADGQLTRAGGIEARVVIFAEEVARIDGPAVCALGIELPTGQWIEAAHSRQRVQVLEPLAWV